VGGGHSGNLQNNKKSCLNISRKIMKKTPTPPTLPTLGRRFGNPQNEEKSLPLLRSVLESYTKEKTPPLRAVVKAGNLQNQEAPFLTIVIKTSNLYNGGKKSPLPPL
jgi:hypothetical protein